MFITQGDITMNELDIDQLTEEIATLLNKKFNLPLINEDNEQKLFEFLVHLLLTLLLDRIRP
jgi:hypothetical protein